ncbi:MAG: DUF2510 domain-containing protein [Microbacteriaceae bacterium]|nr:DUF2510 domain-containing protein [Microbacteriaceae bacterium]
MNDAGPAWVPDPSDATRLRWFDGTSLTEHTMPNAAAPQRHGRQESGPVPPAVPQADPGRGMGLIGFILAFVTGWPGAIVGGIGWARSRRAGHRNALGFAAIWIGAAVSLLALALLVAVGALVLRALDDGRGALPAVNAAIQADIDRLDLPIEAVVETTWDDCEWSCNPGPGITLRAVPGSLPEPPAPDSEDPATINVSGALLACVLVASAPHAGGYTLRVEGGYALPGPGDDAVAEPSVVSIADAVAEVLPVLPPGVEFDRYIRDELRINAKQGDAAAAVLALAKAYLGGGGCAGPDPAGDASSLPEPAPGSSATDATCDAGEHAAMLVVLSAAVATGQYTAHPMAVGVELVERQDRCLLHLQAMLDPGSEFTADDLKGLLSLAIANPGLVPAGVERLWVTVLDEHGLPWSMADVYAGMGADASGVTAESGISWPMDVLRDGSSS